MQDRKGEAGIKRLENEREVGIWGRNNRERKGRRVRKKDEESTPSRTRANAQGRFGHRPPQGGTL